MAGERGDRPNITHTDERGNTVADKTAVRTTITPGEVIEVTGAELIDLERQGLIHSREGDESWQQAEPVETDSGVITDGLAEQATTGDAGRLADKLEGDEPKGNDEAPASSIDEQAPRKAPKSKGV